MNRIKIIQSLLSSESKKNRELEYTDNEKYLAPIKTMVKQDISLYDLLKYTTNLKIVRIFEDGNFVITHLDFFKDQPMVGFAIFLFDEDQVVAHWGISMVKPDRLNPSGHSTIDGPTQVNDLDKSGANRVIIANAMEILVAGTGLPELAKYFDGDNYINHNPQASDGLTGLAKGMAERIKNGIITKYNKVNKIFGQGNFVLSITTGSLSGTATLFFDLFRIENGKIAEHWDVVSEGSIED